MIETINRMHYELSSQNVNNTFQKTVNLILIYTGTKLTFREQTLKAYFHTSSVDVPVGLHYVGEHHGCGRTNESSFGRVADTQ